MQDYQEYFQSKENRKIIREYLNDVYSTFKAYNFHFIEKFTFHINSKLELKKNVSFQPDSFFNMKNILLVNEIKNKIKSGPFFDNDLLSDFNPESIIQIGDKLDSITDVMKIGFDTSQPKNFIIEEGKSTIIYLWSHFSHLSKCHLKYLSDKFLINQRQWDAHLRLVFINIDCIRDKDKAIEIVKHLKMFDSLHFSLPFEENINNIFVRIILKYGYPIAIVINSDNIIQFIGSLLDINLDQIVKESVNRNLITSQSVFNKGGLRDDEKYQVKQVMNELDNKLNNLKKMDSLNAPHLVDIKFIVKRIYTVGKFNLVNPKFNNSHQNLQTPSSENTMKMGRKNHPLKQKVTAKEIIIGSNININQDNFGINPLKIITKLNQSDNKLSIINTFSDVKQIPNEKDKPLYTPKKYYADLIYSCHYSDEEVINELFRGLNNISNLNLIKTHSRTEEIEFGSNCFKCKSLLIINIPSRKNSDVGDDEFNSPYSIESTTKKYKENNQDINYLQNNEGIQKEKMTKKVMNTFNKENIENKHFNIKNFDKQFTELSNYNELNNLNINFEYNNLLQYYCIFCNFNLCYECGNKLSDINYPDLNHKHFLILLRKTNKYFSRYILYHNFENDYNIDFKYYSFNHFPKDLKQFKIHFQVKCDGCLKFPISSIRWKCCNCVYKNLCNECFQIILFASNTILEDKINNKQISNDEYFQEIISKMHQLGCDPVHHVFMKILIDGYFY